MTTQLDKDEKHKKYLILMICFNIAVYIFFFIVTNAPVEQGDTVGYQISSLSEITWVHRLPGYQIVNLFFLKLFGGNRYASEVGVCVFQAILQITANILLWTIIRDRTSNKKLSFLYGLVLSFVIASGCYFQYILTESLAVSIMGFQLWLLHMGIKTEKSRYFILLCIIGFVGTMIRPSHIFSLAVFALFLLLFFFAGNKKAALQSSIALALVLSGCMLYANHNKAIIGILTLSDVGIANKMYDVIDAGLYENSDSQETVSAVETAIADTTTNTWADAKSICMALGYPKAKAFIWDCILKNPIKYVKYIYEYMKKEILSSMSMGAWIPNPDIRFAVSLILDIIFPFSLAGILAASLFEVIYFLMSAVIKKNWLWVEAGASVCTLSIYFLSVYACHSAGIQRIGICIVPCGMISVFFFGLHIAGILKIKGHSNEKIYQNHANGSLD